MKKNLVTKLLVLSLFAIATACGTVSSDSRGEGDAADGGGSFFAPAPKVTIPSGTRLRVALIDGVSTSQNSPGDEFTASLAEPVIVDGKMLLEKGTKVQGRVADVQESGRVKGRASIRLILTHLSHDGDMISISTNPFVASAQATKKRDAGIIGGGAGIGAAIGAIAGGGKGAAIGAITGAGAGAVGQTVTRGGRVQLPSESLLTFRLNSPLVVGAADSGFMRDGRHYHRYGTRSRQQQQR
jgi:hypothetical protein